MPYQVSKKGNDTVVGLVSSLCHGFDIDNAASLNGLDVDEAKVLLMIVLAQAGIIDEGVLDEIVDGE